MTFEEYNTDENFNRESNALELAKLGHAEGMSEQQFYNSLSPLWKEDKKGNVKKAVEQVWGKNSDTKYLNETNTIANTAQTNEQKQAEKDSDKEWAKTLDAIAKEGNAFGKIDDKYIASLPKTLRKAFKDGEFGTPTSKDAKNKFGYFIMNEIGSALRGISNAAMQNAGKGRIYDDTTSDWSKIKQTNMAKGLENKWRVNEASTNAAIDLVTKQGLNDQSVQQGLNAITRNARLNTAFNMMNESQKAYMLEVMAKVGNRIGDMSNQEIQNLLIGGAITGQMDKEKMVATLLGKYVPEVVEGIKDGDGINLDLSGNGVEVNFGGKGKIESAGVSSKGHEVTLSDGTKWNPGAFMSDKEYKEAVAHYDEIRRKYANDEIDEETATNDLTLLYNEMQKHPMYKMFKGGLAKPESILKKDTKWKNNKKEAESPEGKAKEERKKDHMNDNSR